MVTFFRDYFANLPSNIQSIISLLIGSGKYKAIYTTFFFNGFLTTGAYIFFGYHNADFSIFGSVFSTDVPMTVTVPGPEIGTGISFVVPVILAWLAYAYYGRRRRAEG